VCGRYGDRMEMHLRPSAGHDAAGHETAAWIAKEKLRDMLNQRGRVSRSAYASTTFWDRLFELYD